MLLVVAGGAVGWLGAGIAVSSAMARRGFDRTAWLVVGVLFGPIAVCFAVVELVGGLPRPPEVVEGGRAGAGVLDVVVVRSTAAVDDVSRALADLDVDLRRLVLARVVPFDGPKDVERQAAASLRADRVALGRSNAELLLLFGPPAGAIADYAVASDISVVVVDRDVPGLYDRLKKASVAVLGPRLAMTVPARRLDSPQLPPEGTG